MLIRSPRQSQMPSLQQLLQDAGDPKPAELGKALGVSERTARRWIADGNAPLTAMLALFWVSSWGQSLMDAELFNGEKVQRGLAAALRCENERLRQLVRKLGHIGEFGSANDPAPEVVPGTPAARPVPAPPATAPSPAKRRTRLPRGLTADESARMTERINARRERQRLRRLHGSSTKKAA